MSLIYAVIARGVDTTLVDYENKASNFPSIANKLFEKLQRETRLTYIYDNNYQIHYINQNGFTYLCLADTLMPKAIAFAFLEDIKDQFCQQFKENVRKQAVNYGMQNQFKECLKIKMDHYNSNPEQEKIARLKDQLVDVANQMSLTLDEILARDDQISILVHNTQNFKEQAGQMKRTATQVRQDQESRALKTKLFIAAVVVSMFLVIYFLY
ncbi:unnamed protein product (macronuclear) [Paramecium tetraurelia]|uniref:Chromosome undetermined scaffold_76, whole genome shotgun sequence n=1 Tax=Paramecium tetraurelia TaxID=5888 RepID=Q7Z0P5_PARTE|nr:uncharacterized protein GSPATT00023002001 [Paramecium tetraurelia]CAD97456.2 synaptobrevin 2 isoform 1 [Paramecium tetraurelia]CAK89829.1 unnamed protein product [Paramecium tetraurelia]|eukprot:XP_001457226.1 hypothetical protein (macronuclear) [Paramecium tetraurelia strain d4-2]